MLLFKLAATEFNFVPSCSAKQNRSILYTSYLYFFYHIFVLFVCHLLHIYSFLLISLFNSFSFLMEKLFEKKKSSFIRIDHVYICIYYIYFAIYFSQCLKFFQSKHVNIFLININVNCLRFFYV